MKFTILLLATGGFFLLLNLSTNSRPTFNGTEPGCGGSGCHSDTEGIVAAAVSSGLEVSVTVSGTTSDVAGELVDSAGNVVAVNNSTSANPFILTAPAEGTYTVNAGYASPSRNWGSVNITVGVTGIEDKLIGNNPQSYELYTNYPNPFNPSTKIRYSLKEDGYTTLKIFNILGKEIATLVNGEKPAGIYEVSINGLDLPSGTYIYKIQSGNFTDTKKMMLIK